MLTLLLVIPAAALVLILCGAPAKATALGAAAANFLLSLWVAIQYVPGETPAAAYPVFEFEHSLLWASLPGLPPIHYHVGIDGISLPLVLLATLVTLAAVWVTPATVARAREYFSYVLLISLGVVGAFVSLDLFFLYIFHEFALVPTFLLIGIWGTQNRQFASLQLTLYLTLGSLILLAGIIALVTAMPPEVRTFDVTRLPIKQIFLNGAVPFYRGGLNGAQIGPLIFGLLLVGCGMLVSLFPFHSWAPPGYASAPPAAAMLHAGVLKKFGLYILLRVAWPLFPDVAAHWQMLLCGLVFAHIFYVGLVTMAQRELTTMLGYSSVMHMGYLFLGLISWNQIGLSGLVLLMVAHGLSTSMLFALAGEIQLRTGEIRFSELGGLGKKAPFLSVMFILASMAALGLPSLPNFVGELLIFFGAWHAHPLVTGLVIWGSVMTAIYFLRAVGAVCFGPLPEKFAAVADLKGFAERGPYLLLAAALLALGFAPWLLLHWVTGSLPPTFLLPR